MSSSAEMRAEHPSNQTGETHTRWRVDGKLLPLKMYYFFFYGASGSFIPFITVYLKHLRLSASEAGLITGLSMLFAMLLRALIAMTADKLSARKTSLLICCLGFGLAFFSMWFVPRRILPLEASTNSSTNSSVDHRHQQDQFYIWICWTDTGREICKYPTSLNSCSCRIAQSQTLTNMSAYNHPDGVGTQQTDAHDVRATDIQRHQDFARNSIDSSLLDVSDEVSYQKHYTEAVFNEYDDKFIPCFYVDCDSEQASISRIISEGLDNTAILQLSDQDDQASNSPTGNRTSLHYRNPTFEAPKPENSTIKCLLNCTQISENGFNSGSSGHETLNVSEIKRSHSQRITADLVFSLSFVLLITGKSLYSASTSLIDAVTYTILGPYSLRWGQQRLWGTVGTGVTVLSITVVSDSRQVESFSELFIACMGLSILAFLIGLFRLRADKTPKNKMFFADLKKLLSSGAVRLFLVKLLFYGVMAGTAQNFIFWFLVDLGSGQITLGVCLLLYCVASVIILRCSRFVLHKIGQVKVMYLTLLAYAIRYLVLSFLTNPWMALPVEVLHAVTYSLFWAAASSTASMVAPPGTQASSQGLAGAMYWDLGRGVGIVIAGQLLQLFGARWTFRAYSLLCVGLLPVFWILDRTWTLQKSQVEKRNDTKEKDGEVGEELLKSTTVNGFLLNNNEDKGGAFSRVGHLDVPDARREPEHHPLYCMEVQIPESASVVYHTNAQPCVVEMAHIQETRFDLGTLHSEGNITTPTNTYSMLFSNDVHSPGQVSINNHGSDSVNTNSKLSNYDTDDSRGETGNFSIPVQSVETSNSNSGQAQDINC